MNSYATTQPKANINPATPTNYVNGVASNLNNVGLKPAPTPTSNNLGVVYPTPTASTNTPQTVIQGQPNQDPNFTSTVGGYLSNTTQNQSKPSTGLTVNNNYNTLAGQRFDQVG
jgi:hypothetical protein